ncbi:hypothetical protein CF394_04890 [Tetzosporium hominis]|uniref:Uncharacterized protein n=1 Tax=Tetzosporium hominis TaxID=2020506 RepID=A0A264W4X3_9BACL|nr:hypothetical protein [Tetzosporium hominis]OZS78624.1 hypothetical protein CF394_04890 [Tetzosporium hominis]
MEKNYRREKPFNENRLMLRQAGFGLVVLVLFIPYFKFAAYVSDRFFFNSYFISFLVLLLGIPLCYFATKSLVQIVKNKLQL